jgi:hypothetical protein
LSAAELTGTWSSGCILDDVNDISDGYELETINFTAEGFAATAGYFSEAGCTVVMDSEDAMDVRGIYTLGQAVTTTNGQPATQIDLPTQTAQAICKEQHLTWCHMTRSPHN